ncbi:dTDP-4-dehydrorhamnose reductase [Sinobacterium norvegicum]|uniref:dTDP-4-dehydrorhamnose reductase n=1 Tax=Sinobacterium norvegicum TaxID=1641715 RepID=A0ABM9AJ64_9GAMM|nr:sugar nucleotide-binding protein [Sinobacterium norvegicum]CAH0993266.1 dTDP-4-dehydrorhamnose reductase [Sinobacterium norvegicum]
MRVLVLDSDSRVGTEVVAALLMKDYRVEGITREQLADAESLQAIDHHTINIVINCYILQSTELSSEVGDNDIAFAAAVAERCQQQSIILLHLSSSQVFLERHSVEYTEDDEPAPNMASGRALLAAEQAIMVCDKQLTLRVGWAFSNGSHGLFEDLLMRLETGEELIVHAGAEGCPTPAVDVARVVVACAEQLVAGAGCYGLYHYCSSDPTNSEGFVEAIIATGQQYGYVDPEKVSIKLVDNGELYGIPPHPVLNCHKILNHFGIKQRPWRSVMASLLKERYQESD